MVMPPTDPCIPPSDLFHTSMGSPNDSKSSGFDVIPMERCTLGIWDAIFQVLEAEYRKTLMLSPKGMRIAKGEALKST